jgi:hypothetical protein
MSSLSIDNNMKYIIDLCNKYDIWIEFRPNCISDTMCVRLTKFFEEKYVYHQLIDLVYINYISFETILENFVDKANKEFMNRGNKYE